VHPDLHNPGPNRCQRLPVARVETELYLVELVPNLPPHPGREAPDARERATDPDQRLSHHFANISELVYPNQGRDELPPEKTFST
jgi:hypothetical protein